MRYAHGGGLTPRGQEKRQRVRLEAAERFARGEKTEAVARELRVTARSVRRWRRESGDGDWNGWCATTARMTVRAGRPTGSPSPT
ncbi:helix-turn-helix domain-containing protein [Streptomyces sp. NBC_00286]|nr:helix-turn-helix domain-containing protein [Streptomyces sp. NBC_00286]